MPALPALALPVRRNDAVGGSNPGTEARPVPEVVEAEESGVKLIKLFFP